MVDAEKQSRPGAGPRVASHSDLEVAKPFYSPLPEAAGYEDGKIVTENPDVDTNKIVCNEGSKFSVGKKRFGMSRKRLYIILAVVILVIVAAVVGSVVGVLKRKEQPRETNNAGDESSGESSNAPNGNTADANSTGNLIWNQTSLAVTGWRYNDEKNFSMRLFYQDAEGYLRISAMESTSKENWTPGAKLVKAKQGTPLAASCNNQSIYEPKKSAMETHLFYLDEESILREHVFRDSDDTGFSGSLGAHNITPAGDTQLASYWPFLAYQNSDKTFSEARYNCTTSGINCWNSENLKVAGPGPSTALAMVPTGRNMNGTFLLYQREDGDLVNSQWENSTNTWSSKGPSVAFSRTQSISALAMPQRVDGIHLNFHLLYQEVDDSDISWLWRNAGQWREPAKPEPLKGAMKGTSIACLTAASWWDKELAHEREMSRCYYFGVEGRLRSVHRKDGQWLDLGVVDGIGLQ